MRGALLFVDFFPSISALRCSMVSVAEICLESFCEDIICPAFRGIQPLTLVVFET